VDRNGQRLLPAIEFEDGTIVREESADLAARIRRRCRRGRDPLSAGSVKRTIARYKGWREFFAPGVSATELRHVGACVTGLAAYAPIAEGLPSTLSAGSSQPMSSQPGAQADACWGT
jgi:hypothetical protein